MAAGAGAMDRSSSNDGDNLHSFDLVDFVIKSGRAVFYPVLTATYERRDGFRFWNPEDRANSLNDHYFTWFKEMGRSIDYLETREDIDIGKLAFFGSSWGAITGPVVVSMDPRIKIVVFRLGGLFKSFKPGPLVDQFNQHEFANGINQIFRKSVFGM